MIAETAEKAFQWGSFETLGLWRLEAGIVDM